MQKIRKYILFLLIIIIGLFLNTGFIPIPPKAGVSGPIQPEVIKPVPFDDIAGHWAEAAISEMYLKEIIKGYPDNTFKPNNPISKIQAVVMLVRVMGLEPNEELADDLPYFQETFNIPRWANGYVLTALNEKMIEYSELETLGSQQPLARQDAARLIIRALSLSKEAEKRTGGLLSFSDTDEIKPEFTGYVSLAVEKGLMSVNVNNAFLPLNPVTRAEITVLFSRADAFMPEHDREITGTYVYSSDFNKLELNLLNKDGVLFTIALTDNCLFFRDGKSVGLKDLLDGDTIKVIKNSQDEGVLILAASAPKPESKTIPFETIKLEAESSDVQKFVADNKVNEGFQVFKQNGYLYVLATRGEKPNSGYSVEITKITGIDKDNVRDLDVTVVKSDPKPGFFYNPVLTYRFALAKVPLDSNDLGQLTFVDETGQILKQIP